MWRMGEDCAVNGFAVNFAGMSFGIGLNGVYSTRNNDVLVAGWFSGGQLTFVSEAGGLLSYSRGDGEGTVPELRSFTMSGGAEVSAAAFRRYAQPIFRIEKVR